MQAMRYGLKPRINISENSFDDIENEIVKISETFRNGEFEIRDRNSNFCALWGRTDNYGELFKRIITDICQFGESIVTKLNLISYHGIWPYLILLQQHLEGFLMDYDEFSEILSIKLPMYSDFLPANIAIIFDDSITALKIAREAKITLKHFVGKEIPIFPYKPDNAEDFDILIKIIGKNSKIDEETRNIRNAIVLTIPSADTYSFKCLGQYLNCKNASFNIDNGYGAAVFCLKILNVRTKTTGSVLLATAGLADNYVMDLALDRLTDNQDIKNIYCLKDIGINNIDGTISSLKALENRMKQNYDGLEDGDFGFDATIVFAGFEGALSVLMASKINGSVISVPTGVGYGTNYMGIVTYLTMINGCGAGTVTVSPADIETACDLASKIMNIRSRSWNKVTLRSASNKITYLN